MKPWEVWLADVPYVDIPESKARPVIILDDNTVLVIGLYVTSASPRPMYNDYILKDLEAAGVSKESTVRLDGRLRLEHGRFLKKLGTVSERDRLLIKMRL